MSDSARPGFELPLLLLLGFRTLIDRLHVDLAAHGHPEARPMHGFVCQAVGPDGTTAVELGRRLGVSKQAAGKLVEALEQSGYLERTPDPFDGRRKRVTLTFRGRDLLARSARTFDELRDEWASVLGAERLNALQDDLERVCGSTSSRLLDVPGWFGAGR